jgi:hypothetical protein
MLKPAIVCKHKQTRHQANSTLPHAWTGRGGLAQKEGKIPPAVDVRQRIAVVCKKVNRPSPMPGQARGGLAQVALREISASSAGAARRRGS